MANFRKEQLLATFTSPHGNEETNLKIHCTHWTNVPNDTCVGVVIGLHGMGEHAGRYREFGDILNSRGFLLCMLDHRGHGQSEGTRQWAESVDPFIDDVCHFTSSVKAAIDDDLPVFLFGHSMGGELALLSTLKLGSDSFTGVALSAPAVMKGEDVGPVTVFAAKALNFVASRMIIKKVDASSISTQEDEQQAYLADPLNGAGATAGLGASLLEGLDIIADRVPKEFTAPFIVIHGDADTLVSLDGTHWLVDNAPATDKTKVILKGSRHESFRDFNRGPAYEAIIRWLEARL